MKTKKDQRAAALKAAQALIDNAKAGNRDLTEDEVTELTEFKSQIERLDADIARIENQDSLLKGIADLAGSEPQDGRNRSEEYRQEVKSLGEHFVKAVGDQLKQMKGRSGQSVAAPEYKAANTTHTVGEVFQTPVLTTFDRTIVTAPRQRLVIADLLGQGTLSGNAISYFVEGIVEGSFTTVAEGGAKPQLHVADPTTVTDALSKIAGWIKLSDEMIEDLDFVVSEINNRLLYELRKTEEDQLLNGNGTGSNLLGLLKRPGVQTQAFTDSVADTIFRAMTAVSTATDFDADGIAINPIDYQNLRLSKDANGQYFGGGFFAGQYGNGTIMEQPPIWGLRTVITPAVAVGQALVGAFGSAATVYRKGGVRVESTNSHADDFTNNLVTVRVEERIALAVRYPSAFVKAQLAAA